MSIWQGWWSKIHLASSTVLVPGSTKMNETEIKMQTLGQMNLIDVTCVNWTFSSPACLWQFWVVGQSCPSDPFILSNICTKMIEHWLVSISRENSAQGKHTDRKMYNTLNPWVQQISGIENVQLICDLEYLMLIHSCRQQLPSKIKKLCHFTVVMAEEA